MQLGPVQVVVVGLADADAVDELVPELRRLRALTAIRLIDVVLLHKDEQGRLVKLDLPRRSAVGSADFGDAANRLVGAGHAAEPGMWVGPGAGVGAGSDGTSSTQAWAVSDAIPPGVTAAVMLIEHRWAVLLQQAVVRARGFALEDTWVLAEDLIATGAALPGC